MKKNKLSLVRETIRPLTHDDLEQVAGGGIADAIRSRPGSIIGTLTTTNPTSQQTCFPKPGTTTSAITGGPLTGTITSGRVSGVSNAF